MLSNNCKFHKNGHCRSKTSCIFNHNFPNCPQGRFCPQKSDCQFRHVKICPIFPKCPYTICSYYHPPPNLLPPPLFPHPASNNSRKMLSPSHPTPHDQVSITMLSQRVTRLEEHITGLEKQISALTTSANTEVQNLSNKLTNEIEEAPAVENILTISDDSPENNTGIAPDGSPATGELEQKVTDHMISKVNTIQSDLQQNLKSRVKD